MSGNTKAETFDKIHKEERINTPDPSGSPNIRGEEEGVDQNDPTQSPSVQGEGEASGSAPSVTSDDDVGKMVEETLGEEPKPGETIADIVNKAEKERHERF